MTGAKIGGNSKKNSERQKKLYAAYRAAHQGELNKMAKLEKHLKKHPNDKQSKERKQGTYPKIDKKIRWQDTPLDKYYRKYLISY